MYDRMPRSSCVSLILCPVRRAISEWEKPRVASWVAAPLRNEWAERIGLILFNERMNCLYGMRGIATADPLKIKFREQVNFVRVVPFQSVLERGIMSFPKPSDVVSRVDCLHRSSNRLAVINSRAARTLCSRGMVDFQSASIVLESIGHACFAGMNDVLRRTERLMRYTAPGWGFHWGGARYVRTFVRA